ncbi:MAG: response regulator transcription factor [Desulfuromonadaceae bacterium]|nr:response regulator transcription factor [Desulfuromonadaceae bacterium]
MKRLLIVEDDEELRGTMVDYLTLIGYQVAAVATVSGFYSAFDQQPVDLILLDLNLPDDDGLNLLTGLRRRQSTPVFVVSGRCDDASRLSSLEMRADDYITKPFNICELGLRIRNFFSRQELSEKASEAGWQFGRWSFKADGCLLNRQLGKPVSLTLAEAKLLSCLLQAEGQVVSCSFLVDYLCCNKAAISPDSLPVIVSRLRRKLQAGNDASMIVNVQGAGYRLAVPVQQL